MAEQIDQRVNKMLINPDDRPRLVPGDPVAPPEIAEALADRSYDVIEDLRAERALAGALEALKDADIEQLRAERLEDVWPTDQSDFSESHLDASGEALHTE